MADITLDALQAQGGAVTTTDDVLNVAVSNDNPLPVGNHAFELVVVDDSGNRSQPVRVQVIVRDTQAPTAVLNVASSEGRPLPNNAVEFGSGFMLTARGSLDVPPGRIAEFVWTLVG